MYSDVSSNFVSLVTAKIKAGISLHEAQRRAVDQIYADILSGAADPTAATAFLISEECLASGTISGTSNANPDVITTPAAHGLNPGDALSISGVGGDTAVNGNWVVGTTPSPTTFTLCYPSNAMVPLAGDGAYTSGGTFVRNTFPASPAAAALNVPNKIAAKNW
jgi:hypothetical protein